MHTHLCLSITRYKFERSVPAKSAARELRAESSAMSVVVADKLGQLTEENRIPRISILGIFPSRSAVFERERNLASAPSTMHRLLACPVSRVVHVQRTSLCSRSLARGLSTSTRRNFDATAPVNKRNSAYDANVFGDLIDGAAPKEPKGMCTEVYSPWSMAFSCNTGSSSTPKTKSQQQANPPRLESTRAHFGFPFLCLFIPDTVLESTSRPSSHHSDGKSPSLLRTLTADFP